MQVLKATIAVFLLYPNQHVMSGSECQLSVRPEMIKDVGTNLLTVASQHLLTADPAMISHKLSR